MNSKNVDISRLILTTAILVLGFIAIGFAYQSTVSTNTAAQDKAAKTKELVAQFEEVRGQMELAREAADSFFATGSIEFYETFQAIMANVNGLIATIEHSSELSESELESAKLQRDTYNRLNELTEESSNIHIQYGLDYSVGLRGDMFDAAKSLETKVAGLLENQNTKNNSSLKFKNTLFKLQSSMYKMFLHEKNYMERGDEAEVENLIVQRLEFIDTLDSKGLTELDIIVLTTLVDAYFEQVLRVVETRKTMLESDAATLEEFASLSDVSAAVLAIVTESADTVAEEAKEKTQELTTIFYLVLVMVLLIMIASFVFLGRNLTKTMAELQVTIEDRAQDLKFQERENELLSESVLKLMDAADRLSNQDLTVKIPVSADITGAVSDALNIMTKETASTMININDLAGRLEQAANHVSEQNDKVTSVASTEKKVVNDALTSLSKSAKTMKMMGSLAGECNNLADNASNSTTTALEAVQNTVDSMMVIRGTVSESEKSIKRLGERSKEIGAIIEIIKDIAERTHTLALNAGMQAVAAGDAGRGFSVVADEVQRLAEMARESTSQVTSLVKSIQSESSESMNVMNKAISQVVEGSEKAENAGQKMKLTQQAAGELAEAVERIVKQSNMQNLLNTELRKHAAMLKKSTEATETELVAQAEETKNMVGYLDDLVNSVRVFKLPNEVA